MVESGKKTVIGEILLLAVQKNVEKKKKTFFFAKSGKHSLCRKSMFQKAKKLIKKEMKTDRPLCPNSSMKLVVFENVVEINLSNVPMAWASDSQPWVHLPLGVREELKFCWNFSIWGYVSTKRLRRAGICKFYCSKLFDKVFFDLVIPFPKSFKYFYFFEVQIS
jgi:hypothetical protein